MEFQPSNGIKRWVQELYEKYGLNYDYGRAIMESWPYLIFNFQEEQVHDAFKFSRMTELFNRVQTRVTGVREAAGLGTRAFVVSRVKANDRLFVVGFSSKEDAINVKAHILNTPTMTVSLAS
jgi:hypothetical protein